MATMDELTGGARTFLRDYPQYFELDEGPLNVLTIRLPHPLVSGSTLQAYVTTPPVPPATVTTSVPTTAWSLDERNGLLKFTDEAILNKQVLVSGYYFSWFSDSDLAFHVNQASSELLYNTNLDIGGLSDVQSEVVMLGSVVHALWSLAMELSLDIDVSTPEGMFIPARQRFTQVLQMLQYWDGVYSERAAMLNMGLNALEIFRLRRVTYMTGRYAPVYREREFDDPRPPERLYPPIPDGTMSTQSTGYEIEEFTR